MTHSIGRGVTDRIAAASRRAWAGLGSASITTTPESVTTKAALGCPSEPRPVSPTAAYTPGASRRTVGNGPSPPDRPSAGMARMRTGPAVRRERSTGETRQERRAGPRGRISSGGREADVDGLLEGGTLIVGPDHGQWCFLRSAKRKADDRVPADAGGPFESGYLLSAVGYYHVPDEVGRYGVAVRVAEESRIHGM